ncbi:MAG: SlyX family protein [Anaerobiospirillum succiniciproducens]|uniref:SlyX family protein n=1 Tax=Anaerobiospirillum succiniciproducens TaxID=13335 RepID=UPI0026DB4E29|nr:SlyX family protein [Anaerobiospirillum succiniciproducens]MDO4676743.1 SlyX family protein [Anaerobiospirillum succiniciproducens]
MAGEKNCEVEALEQRCAQLENDMQKMQERLAWMDMTLNDTGKYIDNLLDRVDKLERQIKFLASMQDAPASVRPLSEETPPPHY